MESLIRNVGDINAHDRQALEHVLGQSLRENQQLVIHIVNLNVQPEPAQTPATQQGSDSSTLPEWCNVYEGLSDTDITEMEQTILQRADLGRPTE
jgi:hypothetical protein